MKAVLIVGAFALGYPSVPLVSRNLNVIGGGAVLGGFNYRSNANELWLERVVLPTSWRRVMM
jgi:hypothetical protein